MQLKNGSKLFGWLKLSGQSGQVSYSAPSGFHDDCVDALALAVSASSPTPKTIPSTF